LAKEFGIALFQSCNFLVLLLVGLSMSFKEFAGRIFCIFEFPNFDLFRFDGFLELLNFLGQVRVGLFERSDFLCLLVVCLHVSVIGFQELVVLLRFRLAPNLPILQELPVGLQFCLDRFQLTLELANVAVHGNFFDIWRMFFSRRRPAKQTGSCGQLNLLLCQRLVGISSCCCRGRGGLSFEAFEVVFKSFGLEFLLGQLFFSQRFLVGQSQHLVLDLRLFTCHGLQFLAHFLPFAFQLGHLAFQLLLGGLQSRDLVLQPLDADGDLADLDLELLGLFFGVLGLQGQLRHFAGDVIKVGTQLLVNLVIHFVQIVADDVIIGGHLLVKSGVFGAEFGDLLLQLLFVALQPVQSLRQLFDLNVLGLEGGFELVDLR